LTPSVPTAADLVPPDPVSTDRETWRELITASYQKLCAQIEAGEATVLDDYATTNEQEFFAVATEVFFERPAALQEGYPELYAGLKFCYRLDPLTLHPQQPQP
jgi:Mlc titration factor MtfA (ptsG expression regulator)